MVKLETSSGERLLLFLPLGLLRCLLSPLRHVALLVSSGDVAKCSRESTCTAIRLHHSAEKNSALRRTLRLAAPRACRNDRCLVIAARTKPRRALHKIVALKIFHRGEKPAWNGPFSQFHRARARVCACTSLRAFAPRGSQFKRVAGGIICPWKIFHRPPLFGHLRLRSRPESNESRAK